MQEFPTSVRVFALEGGFSLQGPPIDLAERARDPREVRAAHAADVVLRRDDRLVTKKL